MNIKCWNKCRGGQNLTNYENFDDISRYQVCCATLSPWLASCWNSTMLGLVSEGLFDCNIALSQHSYGFVLVLGISMTNPLKCEFISWLSFSNQSREKFHERKFSFVDTTSKFFRLDLVSNTENLGSFSFFPSWRLRDDAMPESLYWFVRYRSDGN